MARLLILGGLPATGKSSICRLLCERMGALWLRVDTVEQRLIDAGMPRGEIGGTGYSICYGITADNLRNGLDVVADTVNPIELTRSAWREVAMGAGASFLEIEVLCSDRELHRRRAVERRSDVPGLRLPTWEEIENRHYEQWDGVHLRLDTAVLSCEEAVERVIAYYAAESRP